MGKAKPFDIPKREVWEAFKCVKANQGAAGVDRQSIADFEADLSNNLYKLWNRLSSGSYFPPPVRRVDIPKADGGTRPLGIPTVADRIAQEVARRYLEPYLEAVFHADAYGYRPGRSAIDAVRQARQRCWRYDWVLDIDVSPKGFAGGGRCLVSMGCRHVARDRGCPHRVRVGGAAARPGVPPLLMGDGVRVLTRAMKKITKIAGEVGTKLRNRSRSVKLRVLDIARAARAKGPQSRDKLRSAYGKLLSSTSRVVGQAKRFAKEIAEGVKRASDLMGQLALDALRQHIDEMVPPVRQVMKQTRARIYRGDTRAEGKIVSLFEPTTEVIRKGKAAKPTEFGKMIKLQEAENQIVIEYEVYDRRPNDSDLLVPAIETHQATFGRVPHLLAADAAFYSGKNEAAAKAKGVKRVCIPNRSTKSPERKREQRKRWFRNGQKWRTGCEGRISVAKRRHGLNRCRYRGDVGIKRWVGLGVIADNLINIGRAIQNQGDP